MKSQTQAAPGQRTMFSTGRSGACILPVRDKQNSLRGRNYSQLLSNITVCKQKQPKMPALMLWLMTRIGGKTCWGFTLLSLLPEMLNHPHALALAPCRCLQIRDIRTAFVCLFLYKILWSSWVFAFSRFSSLDLQTFCVYLQRRKCMSD